MKRDPTTTEVAELVVVPVVDVVDEVPVVVSLTVLQVIRTEAAMVTPAEEVVVALTQVLLAMLGTTVALAVFPHPLG